MFVCGLIDPAVANVDKLCCSLTDDDNKANITVSFCFYDNTPIYVTAVFDHSDSSVNTIEDVRVRLLPSVCSLHRDSLAPPTSWCLPAAVWQDAAHWK